MWQKKKTNVDLWSLVFTSSVLKDRASGYEAHMASTTTKNDCWSLITTSHTKQLVTTAKDECNSEVVVALGGCVYQWTTHSSRASRGIGLNGYSHHNKVTNGLKLGFPLVWTPNRFHSWCIEFQSNLDDSEDHLVSDDLPPVGVIEGEDKDDPSQESNAEDYAGKWYFEILLRTANFLLFIIHDFVTVHCSFVHSIIFL